MSSDRHPLLQAFDCEAPVALITGSGAPRVGRVIAEELSRRGCHVALHASSDTSAANLAASDWQQRFDREALVVQGSFEKDASFDRIVHDTEQHFGRLDILVNSAAIWFPRSLDEITPDEVRRYFQINTVSTLFCARAAARVMRDQPKGGAIINIGDWATERPYTDHAAYFPSKGAIETVTRSLAVELAAWNPSIRVNCVHPGPVLLTESVSQEVIDQLTDSTLVGRIGTPDDVALAVAALCENTFITGQSLTVDGGRRVYAPDRLQRGYNTG